LEITDIQSNTGGGQPGAVQSVGHRTRSINRQLIAEGPGAGQAGRLIGSAGLGIVMIATARCVELREHPAQRRLTQSPNGTRGEPQAIVAPGQVALFLQLSLKITESLNVAQS